MTMNNLVNYKDFDSICRICLSFKDAEALCWNLEIIHMLEACSSIQETLDSKLPKHVCTTCYDQLKQYFQFQQQYLISIQILTDIVLKLEENNKDSSIKNETDDDEKFDIPTIPANFTLPLDVDIVKKEENNDLMVSSIEIKPENSVKRKRIPVKKLIYAKPRIKLRRKIKEKLKSISPPEPSSSPIPETDEICNNDNDFPQDEEDGISEGDIDFQIPEKKSKGRKGRPSVQDDQTEWICDICGKKFSKKVYMKKHQVIHSENRPFECYICHKTFKLKWSMKEHVKTQHTERDKRVMCPICGKLILPKSINYHKNKYHKENKEKFKCDKCDRQYTQKSGLQTHIKEKHMENDTMYFCDLCNKGFVLKGSLRMHKKYTHMKEKNLACTICGKTFKMLSNMNHHINAHHKNLKPHACSVCNKAFYTKFLLKKHMICHTGERPFTCTICGKSFGFKSVLTTHMKGVHSKS